MRPDGCVVSDVAVLVLEDATGVDSGKAVDLLTVNRSSSLDGLTYVQLSAKRSKLVVFPVLWQDLLL